MTDTPEFRSQPKPEDWVIPADFEEAWKEGESSLDPVGLAILKEHKWDGVPIPFGFQTVKAFSAQMEKLDSGISPDVVADELIEQWAENESRYPDTGMWDRGRGLALATFVEKGHPDQAQRVATTISDTKLLVKTVFGLQEMIPPETAVGLVVGALETGDQERRIGVARALRDHLIQDDPQNEMIDTFDGIVAMFSGKPDYDMVTDWVASQREADKDIDWSHTEALLRNDDSYKSMPMPLRMFSHLMYIETAKEIADDKFDTKLEEGWVDSVIGYYDNAQDGIYAEAAIWGHELGNIAKSLIEKGHTEPAVEVAAAIRDPRLMATMVLEFVRSGHDEEAVALAVRNPDHKLTAELLLDVEYKDRDIAVEKLSEIVQSDDYPDEKRIGCLEVIRDRMVEMGQPDSATKYQEMVDAIRSESD